MPLKTRTQAVIGRSRTLVPSKPTIDAIVPHHQSSKAPKFALADHVNWLRHPWGDNFVGDLAARRLHPAKQVPIHGKFETHEEVLQTPASSPSDGAANDTE